MPDAGDYATATLTVDPYDGTTTATLAVTSPAGTVAAVPVTPAEGGKTWTGLIHYATAGVWTLAWTVTGTGAGREVSRVSVGPGAVAATGRVYATTAMLADYLREAPPLDADQLLAEASRFLDSHVLRLCQYDTAADGLPTDSVVASAIGRAVCAQVRWWIEVGDHVGAAGAGWGGVSIGSVNLSRSVTAVQGGDSAARQVAPQVFDELSSPDLYGRMSAWVGGW
ncbi:hypothetical protein ACFUGD_01760 [Streptomyces sp. NPDC057217]|uniref:hypothetical protein n=1 Tax=Streptomyces sp. NPDC057217 TaxID=3346054 RepID=UPI0036302AC5